MFMEIERPRHANDMLCRGEKGEQVNTEFLHKLYSNPASKDISLSDKRELLLEGLIRQDYYGYMYLTVRGRCLIGEPKRKGSK